MLNRLSFDVEDWYHSLDPEPDNWRRYESRVEGSTRLILDLLEAARVRATFFVLGDVARLHPALVREIHARGHEVASHGMEHRFVYRQTPAEFRADVGASLDLLGSLTGAAVRGYRAPYFSITQASLWALPILSELGVRYDSSIFPVINHRYGIPGAPRTPHRVDGGLLEVPVATLRIGRVNVPCGGGVYFRILPYPLLRAALRALNRRGEEFVFYLHPWECDPGQPRISAPAALRVRHYWGLARTAEKLRRLLDDFPFAPLGGLVGS